MSLILYILEKMLDIGEIDFFPFLECILCVIYINSITQGVILFID